MRARAGRARSMRHKRLIYLTHPYRAASPAGRTNERTNEGQVTMLSASSSRRTRNPPERRGGGGVVFLNYIKTEYTETRCVRER